ncbi:hypothetical protein PPACK8108_LOCUS26201 [Phakopsora pachyrhizi]|uniref:TPR-like protein n=1 Tax=Phakopsora pachyrhizi TaxID=170000 RepID=A0AAV0BVF8_PHAPC|nr:hypothetical protein PPACK8108_LOCUS26201 [Phakopsora pachyrhizi]
MDNQTSESNSIPLDPDLFNPDVVGPALGGGVRLEEGNQYPVDEFWGLDQEDAYYGTYEDEDEIELGEDQELIGATTDGHLYPGFESELSDEGETEDDEEEEDDEDEEESDAELDSVNINQFNDLHRLIGAIHSKSSRNDEETSGVLSKEWDRSMDQEMNEIQESEKAMRRGKRKKYKLRGEPELSIEVSILLGRANICFVEKKYDEAIPLFEEVVRIEPLCKMAWNNLGVIYQDLGDFEKSCQFRIIGAHLTSKSSETWKELAAESRQHGLLSQAIYCFSEAIKSGKDDVEAMWDRSYLLYQVGRPRQALAGYIAILKFTPNNPDVLREVAYICATTRETELPIKLYQDALCHYQNLMPTPDPTWLKEGFGLEHVRTLVKLMMDSKQSCSFRVEDSTACDAKEEEQRILTHYTNILTLIKQANRWLQGRWNVHAEGYIDWDRFEDDREFDQDRMNREGLKPFSNTCYEDCPIYPLDNDFRAYMGICRLKLGDEEEAALHFDYIKAIDVETHSELFISIGDAYKEAARWNEALELYHDLSENDSTNTPDIWHKIGECHRKMGNLEGALECYEAVNETDPLDLVAKTQLAEIYELLGNRSKAFEIVNDIIETRRNARESGAAIEKCLNLGNSSGTSQSLGRSNTSSAAKANISKTMVERRLEEDMRAQIYVSTYERLEEICSKLSTTAPSEHSTLAVEYVRLANSLVEGFRRTPALFPNALTSKFSGLNHSNNRAGRRTENAKKSSAITEDTNAYTSSPDFRGISFNNWVRIFVYYAFCCCKISRSDEACEILEHVTRAPVFRQSASMQQVLRLAHAAAAFQKGDYVLVTYTIRWLSKRLEFDSDPVRLISALLSQGFQEAIAFFNSNTQKWLLRKIQLVDNITGKLKSLEISNEEHSPPKIVGGSITSGVKGSTEDKEKELPTDRGRYQSQAYDAVKESKDQDGGGEEDEEEEDESYWKPSKFKPKETNPVFIIIFAQILAGTRGFKSAIVHYLRLYETYPDDQLLNLLLSIAYAHRSMQRQADNRHHQIAQALAFWDHYRKLRSDSFGQEVEYNLARLFHGLGLTSLAVNHYNRVLAMSPESSEAREEDENDLSSLAAYNLVLIYSTGGSMDLANEIIQRYLTA